MERYQQVEALTLVHHSDRTFIQQQHLPFFVAIQNVKGAKPLNSRLNSRDRDEATAVIDGMITEEAYTQQHALGQHHEKGAADLGSGQF